MKRFFCLVFAVLLVSLPVRALEVSASSAVLYDPLTGVDLFEKNPDQQRGMASTTKIMTALVALEQYDPEQEVTIERAWCGIEGSSMYLKPGETLKVIDLIYGLMLQSGNDAAVALSCLLTGESADFVALMNQKAQELGLENTHFDNPNGLDGKTHYSTAHDMARLAACAMENDQFRQVVSSKTAHIGDRWLSNHNKLLRLLDGAVGVKTGFTKACGRCLVSAVERDGRTLIAVTLGAPDDWNDHMRMMEQGFAGLSTRELVRPGSIGKVPVYSGYGASAELYVDQPFSCSLSDAELSQIKTELCGRPFVHAPVASGEQYGQLRVSLNGKTLFSAPVFYRDAVAVRTENQSFWEKLMERFFF